jgi:hypothetical protein
MCSTCDQNHQNLCQRFGLPVENGKVKVVISLVYPKVEPIRLPSGELIRRYELKYELKNRTNCRYFHPLSISPRASARVIIT